MADGKEKSRPGRLATLTFALALAAPSLTGCNLLAGCEPIQPSALPSGASAGQPRFEVHSANVAIWGSGQDQVELYVGLDQFDSTTDVRVGDVVIHGVAGNQFLDNNGSFVEPAVSWREHGCDYTLLLDPSLTNDQVRDYAERY